MAKLGHEHITAHIILAEFRSCYRNYNFIWDRTCVKVLFSAWHPVLSAAATFHPSMAIKLIARHKYNFCESFRIVCVPVWERMARRWMAKEGKQTEESGIRISAFSSLGDKNKYLRSWFNFLSESNRQSSRNEIFFNFSWREWKNKNHKFFISEIILNNEKQLSSVSNISLFHSEPTLLVLQGILSLARWGCWIGCWLWVYLKICFLDIWAEWQHPSAAAILTLSCPCCPFLFQFYVVWKKLKPKIAED